MAIPLSLFSFFFPLSSLMAGGYLIYRSVRRHGHAASPLSGKVRCSAPLCSPVWGRSCAYYRLEIEAFQGGHDPWKMVYRSERRVQFHAGPKPVHPEYADFRLSSPLVISGRLKRDKGIMDAFREEGFQLVRSGAAAFRLAGSSGAPAWNIDEAVVSALMADPKACRALKSNAGREIRVTEHALCVGSDVLVTRDSGPTGDFRGTVDYPLIISDTDDGGSSLREKAAMSLALGLGMVILSFALLLLMLEPFKVAA